MSNQISTLNPFDIFIGLDGKPLNAGYIYIGVAGQDPEINPVQIFWDVAGTQPVAQPIRTLNGYVANGGKPARVAVNGNYSLRVRDKKKQQVFFEPNVLLTSAGGVSGISDTGGFLAQLITSAGYVGYRIFNAAAQRIAEFLHIGSTNGGMYGIQPGMAGINTAAGVDFSIGVGDAVLMLFKASLSAIGIGKVPVVNKGLIQLQGSAAGGIDLGNVDNTSNPTSFDWYEEGTFTCGIKFGGNNTAMTGSTGSGWFTREGNVVTFQMAASYGNKGSSTGNATLTGLPYAAKAATNFLVNVELQNMFSAVVRPGALVQFSSQAVALYDFGVTTGAASALTDAAFPGTAPLTVSVSGSYLCA